MDIGELTNNLQIYSAGTDDGSLTSAVGEYAIAAGVGALACGLLRQAAAARREDDAGFVRNFSTGARMGLVAGPVALAVLKYAPAIGEAISQYAR